MALIVKILAFALLGLAIAAVAGLLLRRTLRDDDKAPRDGKSEAAARRFLEGSSGGSNTDQS